MSIHWGGLLGLLLISSVSLAQIGDFKSEDLSPELMQQIEHAEYIDTSTGVTGALFHCENFCEFWGFTKGLQLLQDKAASMSLKPNVFLRADSDLFRQMFPPAELLKRLADNNFFNENGEVIDGKSLKNKDKKPYSFMSDLSPRFFLGMRSMESQSNTVILSTAKSTIHPWLQIGADIDPTFGLLDSKKSFFRFGLSHGQSFNEQRQMVAAVKTSELGISLKYKRKISKKKFWGLKFDRLDYSESPDVSSPEDFPRKVTRTYLTAILENEQWHLTGSYLLAAQLDDQDGFRSAPAKISGYQFLLERRIWIFSPDKSPTDLLLTAMYRLEDQTTGVDPDLLTSLTSTKLSIKSWMLGVTWKW